MATENPENRNKKDELNSDDEVRRISEYIRALGLDKLAADISDARFSNRILDAHVDYLHSMSRIDADIRLQDEIEGRVLSLHSQLFDKAALYNNTMITLGYAGFFAIWTFVSGTLHPWDSQLIALCLGISLLVFIFWTLLISVHTVRMTSRIALVYVKSHESRQEKIDEILEAETQGQMGAMRIQRLWPFAFFITVVFGFGAGLLLILLLFAKLIGWPFSLHNFVLSI